MMFKSKIKILLNPKQIQNFKSKSVIFLHFEIGIYLVVLAVLGFISNGYAQPISSVELINNAKNYNGNTVVYKGELIGDIMVRGEYAWLNVNDGKNAIGIWIKKELIKDLLYTGSYKAKGDLVEITGKFNRSCAEHGGDLDIHAQSINKISSGSKLSYAVNIRAINFALSLFCIISLVFLLKVLQSRRSTLE